METAQLDGHVAIVTGGASGIGRATAVRLARAGATVAVVDRDEAASADVAHEISGLERRAAAYPVDLRNGSALGALVDRIVADLGGVDILINSAGVTGDFQTPLDVAPETFDMVIDINLKATVFMIQAAAQHMIRQGRGGRIVNLSSSAAFRGGFAPVSYAASKGAINAVTRVAAESLGPHDINVNAVAPGMTKTPMTAGVGGDDAYQAIVTDGPLANLLHRPSEPDDVAAAIEFLCLPGSRQITGQIIHTSAGQVL